MIKKTLRSFIWFQRRIRDEISGAGAVEFALVSPFLVIIVVGTLDLGFGFFRKMQVENAAQAGAQYAAIKGFDETQIKTIITGATRYSAITMPEPPKSVCGCATNTGVNIVECLSTCADGVLPGMYAQISARGTYKTILPYPMIPDQFTFTAQTIVRIQ